MKVKISTDSSCDLTPELLERYEITVLPLSVIVDGKPYLDGREIKPSDIFRHVDQGGEICSTSAVNVSDYLSVFEKMRESCDAVIHINLGSSLSSCYQNACAAAAGVDGVWVVDSQNLSTGTGYLDIAASVMAAGGESPPEIVKEVERIKQRMNTSFVIDKLEYLRRGGRCSSVAAFGANLLNIKPSIKVTDGVLSIDRKFRGSFEKCVVRYLEDKLSGCKSLLPERIFITHTVCSPDVVASAVDMVERLGVFRDIFVTEAGCAISSHCGPNTLGIIFSEA